MASLKPDNEISQRAEAAFAEARAAAFRAADSYLSTAPRTSAGELAPVNCGSAIVLVGGMTRALRSALLGRGAISHGHRGVWVVEGVTDRVLSGYAAQSAQGNSMITDAAVSVLNRMLGDQGEFYKQFRDD
jgi:hypothetical protein